MTRCATRRSASAAAWTSRPSTGAQARRPRKCRARRGRAQAEGMRRVDDASARRAPRGVGGQGAASDGRDVEAVSARVRRRSGRGRRRAAGRVVGRGGGVASAAWAAADAAARAARGVASTSARRRRDRVCALSRSASHALHARFVAVGRALAHSRPLRAPRGGAAAWPAGRPRHPQRRLALRVRARVAAPTSPPTRRAAASSRAWSRRPAWRQHARDLSARAGSPWACSAPLPMHRGGARSFRASSRFCYRALDLRAVEGHPRVHACAASPWATSRSAAPHGEAAAAAPSALAKRRRACAAALSTASTSRRAAAPFHTTPRRPRSWRRYALVGAASAIRAGRRPRAPRSAPPRAPTAAALAPWLVWPRLLKHPRSRVRRARLVPSWLAAPSLASRLVGERPPQLLAPLLLARAPSQRGRPRRHRRSPASRGEVALLGPLERPIGASTGGRRSVIPPPPPSSIAGRRRSHRCLGRAICWCASRRGVLCGRHTAALAAAAPSAAASILGPLLGQHAPVLSRAGAR